METRRIGALDVTVVGLGCNNFGARCDAGQTRAVVHAALDAGVNFFDTADIYGGTQSEEFLGRALAGRRDEVLIATKFGMSVQNDSARSGASARWIRTAAEDSLRRLGTDRIDLYQQHRPDPGTPLDETLGALDELVRAGKVREIGNSNFDGALVREADDVARARGFARYVSTQNHYNLLHRETDAGSIDACRERGLALLPYFPLASGVLTGKYRRGAEPPAGTRLATVPPERRASMLDDETLRRVESLDGFARARGITLLQLAFAWLLSQDVVASVIAGATRPEQVRANAGAASARLSAAELSELDALLG
jgi:aryl-alcohol dehydrogenase-like predicted oxidoreductase